MSVGIISIILRRMVNVVGAGAGSSPVRTSFLPGKWLDSIRPIQKMSLTYASICLVNAKDSGMLFVQLRDLHVPVHFSVLASLTALLQFEPSIVNRFVKGLFCTKWWIVTIWSRPGAIISDYTTLLNPKDVLKID